MNLAELGLKQHARNILFQRAHAINVFLHHIAAFPEAQSLQAGVNGCRKSDRRSRMKKLRLALAATILAAGVFGMPTTFAEEEGAKCECYYPNSNSYGLYEGEGNKRTCKKQDCWVEVKFED